MKLANFPEHGETFLDDELFNEWKEELPKALRGVEAAKKHFVELCQKRLMDEPFTIQDVNTGYVYTLDQCISFAENKRKINDKIDRDLNESIYHKLTRRYGYSGTLGSAQNVTQAFFNSKLVDSIREDSSRAEDVYLTRDTLEQAYRICDYVLAYLKGYIKDPRLQNQIEESKHEIAKNLN